jgi:hypothetical protein
MAALVLIALLGLNTKPPRPRPKPAPHYWRDAEGQVHMTDTPPPAGAEVLPGPPPSALQAKAPKAGAALAVDPLDAVPESERPRWADLRARAAKAHGDRTALAALVHEVTQEARWGEGRRALLLLPVLGFAFMALVGWWLALGLHGFWRPAALGLALLAGLAMADLLVVELVNRPQVGKLREDCRRLLQVAAPQPAAQAGLDGPLAELDAACSFGAAPWRFRAAVAELERRAADLLAGA